MCVLSVRELTSNTNKTKHNLTIGTRTTPKNNQFRRRNHCFVREHSNRLADTHTAAGQLKFTLTESIGSNQAILISIQQQVHLCAQSTQRVLREPLGVCVRASTHFRFSTQSVPKQSISVSRSHAYTYMDDDGRRRGNPYFIEPRASRRARAYDCITPHTEHSMCASFVRRSHYLQHT